eukprot:gene4226-4928_t
MKKIFILSFIDFEDPYGSHFDHHINKLSQSNLATAAPLSNRAEAFLQPSSSPNTPVYNTQSSIVGSDPFNATNNPNGYVRLSVAENTISFDLLKEKLEQVGNLNVSVTQYGSIAGVREGIIQMLENHVFKHPSNLKPSNIIVAGGATALIEAAIFSLCNENDWIIVPSPLFTGFVGDAGIRPRVKIVPASMTKYGEDGVARFVLSTGPLEEVYQLAQQQGANVKAVIICSPNNPTGTVYTREEIRAVADWTRSKGIHLLSDEIYALTTFSDKPFVSIYEALDGDIGEDVHVVTGFSKEFTINGYHIGYFYSQNTRLLSYMRSTESFFPTSKPIEMTVSNIINDKPFLSNFISTNLGRLKDHYNLATSLLRQYGIPYTEGDSGLFIWLDLRKCLRENNFKDEMRVWEMIFTEAKVSISPGQFSLNEAPGFFRIIFSNPSIGIAIERIGRVYRQQC